MLYAILSRTNQWSPVDAMFDSLGEERELEFNDLKKLEFMQKVINESTFFGISASRSHTLVM